VNPPFEGVSELLPRLAGRGVALGIVSSNAEDNVREVLGRANSGLIGHFECGMSIFGKRSRIRKVLRASGVPNSAAIYIGDQETDLEAAYREHVAFGAVSWGMEISPR
jgi:phosphoglycolate phosphatase